MFCEKCGKQIPESAMFCEFCGAKIVPPEAAAENKPMAEGTAVGGSGDIKLCPDGKYRWYYEFPMLKNPTILFTVWKVLLIAASVPGLVVLLSALSDGFLSAVKQFILVYGIGFGAMFVLSCVGYLITAALYGFRYIVLFEMDDKGVTHSQQDKQFKKAQAIGRLTALAGTAKGDPGGVGTGFLAGSRQQMPSEFKKVSAVIGQKKHNTIKVNQLPAKNQVYVKPEDYDFVWEYITSRCKKAEIK